MAAQEAPHTSPGNMVLWMMPNDAWAGRTAYFQSSFLFQRGGQKHNWEITQCIVYLHDMRDIAGNLYILNSNMQLYSTFSQSIP